TSAMPHSPTAGLHRARAARVGWPREPAVGATGRADPSWPAPGPARRARPAGVLALARGRSAGRRRGARRLARPPAIRPRLARARPAFRLRDGRRCPGRLVLPARRGAGTLAGGRARPADHARLRAAEAVGRG